jgi:hypothetical protein
VWFGANEKAGMMSGTRTRATDRLHMVALLLISISFLLRFPLLLREVARGVEVEEHNRPEAHKKYI